MSIDYEKQLKSIGQNIAEKMQAEATNAALSGNKCCSVPDTRLRLPYRILIYPRQSPQVSTHSPRLGALKQDMQSLNFLNISNGLVNHR